MHPIERLRFVARAEGAGPTLLGREAAGALASFASDPVALVTACRRLVERHPAAGTVWWLAARVLTSGADEAWHAAEELEDDVTAQVLAASLPDDASVLVVGWPEQVGEALRRRGDIEVLAVDSADGSGSAFARRLRNAGVDAEDIADAGVAAAAADVDVVLLEASALGPDGFVAPVGSWAAAAVAHHAGVPVWVSAGVGRVLPGRLWHALVQRLDDGADEPWDRADEVVPLDLADLVHGPRGPVPAADAPKRADCPIAPELLKPIS
ncbi:MAG: hypothetical protein QOI20_2552 [Acidimicrobiaceae bacterium]|jgi:hypothetical protein|nr:hypothetical protein [Acidimicrobiaceae bacterium]